MKIVIEPTVILPDVAPLIHLAAGNALHLLNNYGRVIVVDRVAFEATRFPDKPYAKEIAEWLELGQKPGTNNPVEVHPTNIGEIYKKAAIADPEVRLKNAGETGIRDWLTETLPTVEGVALVLYEETKIPKFLERGELGKIVMSATTSTFLHFAERHGLIRSSEELWKKITGTNPPASCKTKMRIHLPKKP